MDGDLSKARFRVLADIAALRPVAGNDDGWVLPNSPRNQVLALRQLGLIERKGSGVMCGIDYHRLTKAGHEALARAAVTKDQGGEHGEG